MKMKICVIPSKARQVAMELDHWLAQEYLLVPLRRAVGVEFHEKPVRTPGNLHAGLQPGGQPLDSWWLIRLDTAIFNLRNQTPLTSSPVKQERALD